MNDNNNKVFVDPSYMPTNVKLELKLVPFIIGIVFVLAYTIFTIAMINMNISYLKTYESTMNIFRFISFILSGRVGFYVVFAWLISIVMVALFTAAASSENMIISNISKVLNGLSILSFVLPFLLILIII